MSQPLNVKLEIKKSVVSETVKTIIRLALFLISVLAVAVFAPLRDRIWPVTPKWLLLVLLVLSLSTVLALVPLVAYLRKKVQALESELNALKANPKYPYKFGVKWDDKFNPLCPHCEAHLSRFQFIHLSHRNAISRVLCAGCGRDLAMTDERGLPIRFPDAKDRMIAAAATDP